MQLGLGGINPTHHVWDALIRRYHCPALKIELLRDNPLRSNIRNWRSAIDPRTFDRTIIERHLKRIKESQSAQKSITDVARGGSSQIELLHTVEGRGFGRGQRLVLFAHYDPHDIIDPHVEITIRELNNSGCDVALITPSTKRSELERLRPLCSSILIKTPHGRDFGSWFIASNSLKAHYPLYHTIIWMNDSTYFPLFDPGTMFGVMERKAHDFWGIVNSYNLRWHIMSWFWAFRRDLVEAGWPNTYIGQYEPGYSKWDQIKNYEMRLPIALRNAGYRTGAYVSADDLLLHIRDHQPTHDKFSGRTDFSMTHDFWDVIIHQFRCPALKVELLRDNPLGLELKDVFNFITQHTTYDAELIRSHLTRIKAVVSSNSRPTIAKPSNDQLQSLDLYQSYTARPFHSALRAINSSENAHSN